MKQQMTKGSFEYIKRRKKRQGLLSFLMFAIAIGIYILGLVLNKNSNSNIFTILAVLFILPSTKMLISYIILLPFHSVSKSDYEEVKKAVPDGVQMFTDVVFSSTEKVMMLDFLLIDHHFIICYSPKHDKLQGMEQYLRDGIAKREFHYQVEAFDDKKRFTKRIAKLHLTEEEKDKDYKEVMEYICSLMV